MSEENVRNRYPFTYADVFTKARNKYTDFVQNKKFNSQMRAIKLNGKLYHERRLDYEIPKVLIYVQFPIGHGKELTFFKNIFPIAELTENPDPLNKVELWKLQPIYAKDEKPHWIWNLNRGGCKLKKPILQACNTHWRIKITRNGKVSQDCKVNKLS